MPPRKRAAAPPKDTPADQSPAVLGDGEAVVTDPGVKDTAPPADRPDGAADGAAPERTDPAGPGPDDPEQKTSEPPTRGDPQETDQPCPECFPNGWPDGPQRVFSVGCTHGTWIRESTT